jgi:gluconate 2-dehydrogenase gamma chain
MAHGSPSHLSRRSLLAGTAVTALLASVAARATVIHGLPAWDPMAGSPPVPVQPGPWQFFTPEEGAAVEALVDRLIPPDPQWPGGKDAGCAVFIDRQLAGPYGDSRGLYMRPPFQEGDPQQGPQSPLTPAMRYRRSLAALDQHCRSAFGGKPFAQIPDDQKDKLIAGLENGSVKLGNTSGRGFFELLLQNTKEGFFADPIYGGNRDLAAWKMIGFPGARYDYRDWVERHNERYPRPPVGIGGRPGWNAKQS